MECLKQGDKKLGTTNKWGGMSVKDGKRSVEAEFPTSRRKMFYKIE